ncbi:MAG: RNA polymerase sigma factor [Myxococcota bacterium]
MPKDLHILRPGPRDEQALVQGLRTGDSAAFHALHARFVGRVLGVARQILRSEVEAEDATQEVFVRVFRSVHRFRGESSLATWIHTITVNCCLTLKKRGSRLPVDTLEDETTREPIAESLPAEDKVLASQVLELLRLLPDEKRIPFYLHHVEGLSAKEVAEVVGTTREAALKRLQRTKSELFRLWQEREALGRKERAR